MEFIYFSPILGVFGDCPECVGEETPPNYMCDPCASVVYPGGLPGFAAKKCTYTFADITDPAEWETAIANKDVFIRYNGNRILGSLPTPEFSEKLRGSCATSDISKQSRTVLLTDSENDEDFSIDDLYNFLGSPENKGKYDIGFITCDFRLIGESEGFYKKVNIKTWPESTETNEDDFTWKAEFKFNETPGRFFQVSLPFLETLTPNVCWVETIVVSGEGGLTTVATGNDLQMIATITPTNATDPQITWSVAPGSGTATINASSGLLTGTGAGTVTVTATAGDGSGVSDDLVITVT